MGKSRVTSLVKDVGLNLALTEMIFVVRGDSFALQGGELQVLM